MSIHERGYPNQGVLMIVFDADRVANPRDLVVEPPMVVGNPLIQMYITRNSLAVDVIIAAYHDAHP